MSNFFDDVQDSSDEEENVDEYNNVVAEKAEDEDEEIYNKWMRSDSEEDSDDGAAYQTGVRSKKTKAVEEIQDLVDQLELGIESSWKESLSIFEKVVKKSNEYSNKNNGQRPHPFLACLQMLLDVMSSKDETAEKSEEEKKGRNKEEQISFKTLSKLIEELSNEPAIKKELLRLQNGVP